MFLLCFVLLHNVTFAQSSIRAKQYATEYGKSLMNTYGTGDAKNCTTVVVEAETEGSDYIMEIEVSWEDKEGAIFKDDVKCIIKGVLTVKADGTNKRFSETYRNDAFAKIARGQKRLELIEKVGKKVIENSNNTPSYSNTNGPFTYTFYNNNNKTIVTTIIPSNGDNTKSELYLIGSKSEYQTITKEGSIWNSATFGISAEGGVKKFTVYPGNIYKIVPNGDGSYYLIVLK